MAADAKVSVLGLLDPMADEGATALAEEIEDAIESMRGKARRDNGTVEEAVIRCIRRIFANGQKGKPLTRVHISRV